MSLDHSTPETGRVGQYRLLQRLGEGGMGVVHLALDPAGKAVAIKVLRPHIASDPDARRRLAREVATLRRVRHPRVAAVIDADVECEIPYLVTDFVPGKPLDTHVRDHGPLPRGHVARIGSVLADALAAIHELGIVHRDVKPANVMLLDGEPVLIDFGIAQVADESRITHTGLVMGTPGYLSPEIIGGEPVSAATDWWGWGATLAFAATGRPPFGTGPIEVVLDRVRRGDCDVEGVDAGLRATLTAALAVDPARRPRPDRLVSGLAAVAPVRPGNRPVNRAGEPTVARRTPAGSAVSTGPEAVTEVVAPPVAWAEPELPPARRFGPPDQPAAVKRQSGPVNGFGGGPNPAPWTRPPADDVDHSDDSDAESGSPQQQGDPARGLLLGLLVVLAAVAAVAPYGAVCIAASGMILARVIDRSSTALLIRRDLRGPRGSDRLMTTLALPWRLLSAALTSALALILPILIGISVVFIARFLVSGSVGPVAPDHPWPLALGMAALLLSAWWGPGGNSLRRGAAKAVRVVSRGRRTRIVIWSGFALILISALTVMNAGDAPPDWGPLGQLGIFDMLKLR